MPGCLTRICDESVCLLFCNAARRMGKMAEGKENKMTKFRWFYNTDKETEWLNRMAEQGWAMTGFCLGFYRFERCEPGEYIYQIDMTNEMFGVSEKYRQFMEETGAEIVCAWGFFVFLRRKAKEGAFELYTDVESSIGHYTKILNLFETASVMQAGCVVSGIYCVVLQYNTFGWTIALAAGLLFLLFQRQAACLRKKIKVLKNLREETCIQPGGNARTNGLLKGAVVVASMFGAIILYAVLHELGHCAAVWLCGGTVTGFYPFGTAGYATAHMTYEGITDGFSNGLVDIFGSVLPLGTAVLVLLFWKGSDRHPLLNNCVGVVTGTFLWSTFSWIVEPIGRLVNLFDYNSDISKFIDTTGLHPAVITLCALLVFGLTCFLFVKRRSRLSLGFINRKAFARFFIFLVTVGFMAMLLAYFGSMGAGTILAQGNIAYTVSDSRDSILQKEYEFQVAEPGEYFCDVGWKLDREGAVGGMALINGDKIILCFTAHKMENSRFFVYLDSGSYTLRFYLLTCEEDWLEWCGITGVEVSGLSDYPWEPDLPVAVTGSYGIMRNQFEKKLGSADNRTVFAEGNVEYKVSDSKNSILQKEYELQVTEPGNYFCNAEWKLDREGAVAAVALKGEKEETYLYSTGNQAQVEFDYIYLDRGSYTLCFYLLTCEEDWLEFCEITGAEAGEGDLSDYPWEPGLPAAVTGSYHIYSDISEENLVPGGNSNG